MKTLGKIGITSLVLLSALGLASCRKKVADDDKTLEIYSYYGGYGESYIKELAKRFEELNPGVKVEVSGDNTPDKVKTKLLAGKNNNTTDLLFAGESFFALLDQGPNALKGYDCILEPLDDVYNYEVKPGLKVEDMINDSYLDFHKFKVNGEKHYYGFSWADSVTGLTYNATKFQDANLEVPLTTNQLIETADKIKAKGEVAFISSTITGYYEYLREILHMQYEGFENYQNFYRGVSEGRYSKDIFKQKGRLYSLEVIEQIVSEKNGRSHKDINTMSYPQSQTKYLIGEGYMMPNGDWLENELNQISGTSNAKYEFKMMKTPIISNIIEKTPTIKDDNMLREVIKYVDGNLQTKPEGVSEEDINIIRDARCYINTLGTNHNAVIPTYATAKELAKDFLKFMCTEEGISIYQRETGGNSLPFDVKYTMNEEKFANLSTFQKSKYEILANAKFANKNFPIVYKGGLGPYTGERTNPEVLLGVKGGSAQTAKQIYDAEINYYNDSVWNAMLTKAGLNK